MNREEAAEEFVQVVCNEYSQSMDLMLTMLNHPVGNEKSEWKEVRKWFHERSPSEQANVQFLMREAIFTLLHSMLVYFDGATGYYLVDGKPVDFELILNRYQNIGAAIEGEPEEKIKISPAGRGEDLHDIFFHLAEKIRSGTAS